MCYAIWRNVKRLCIAASLMRPGWVFCWSLAATCLFNLLTALTQKSPTVHRTNPIHRCCYPMSKHLFIAANSERRTDILITSEMILLEVIFHHGFCSSLKWNVSCSCLLANKNKEGSSHYWRLVKLPIRKATLGCFDLTMQSNCIVYELARWDNTVTNSKLDLAGAFKIPRVMDQDCWLDITSSRLNGWSWYIFRRSCKVIAFMGISKRNLHSLTLP